ncbi:hypothetical protein APHAL10511_008132 [Amanita phalloides]|nr:hypothetical protein APHAL10511_008132 [Amanita phalloides]
MSGMNMGTDAGSGMSQMMSFLHFTPIGDTLWFHGWITGSPGAMIGACIGLFLLAIFERYVAAARAIVERAWYQSAQYGMSDKLNEFPHHKSPLGVQVKNSISLRSGPHTPAFILSQDLARGAVHMVHSALKYLFMLAVMTFQLGFIISICIGAGVGEVIFGRHIGGAGGPICVKGHVAVPEKCRQSQSAGHRAERHSWSMDSAAPPVIPTELQLYNSYVEDPKWQRKFTIVWASVLGVFVLAALPRLFRRVRSGAAFVGLLGMTENKTSYERVAENEGFDHNATARRSGSRHGKTARVLSALGSFWYWTLPKVGLTAGQISIVSAYLALTLTCIVCHVPLIDNPNRAGFLALAQLPPVFIFATKNSVVSFLLGPGAGYEKLNFIHRWSGRGLFLAGLIHGSLWIRNYVSFGLPILGQQKQTSGVACLSLLSIIALSSLRPVRRYLWNVFWILHFLCYIAFFITVCNHTMYALPWIFPPLAFFGLDLLMRMIRIRLEDAFLVPVDKQMTLVHVPYKTSGWTAGQFVRLRVFFRGRFFESHPFTIMCAPPMEGCLARPLLTAPNEKSDVMEENTHSDSGHAGYTGLGFVLGVRASGDWTKALNEFAHEERQRLMQACRDPPEVAEHENVPVPAYIMIDGPYGGCSIDPSAYETVLFVSGGSGVTFTIGLLDDLVGKCLGAGQVVTTRKIEFVWYIRSFGTMLWFSNFLDTIARHAATCLNLDLHITIYVTCLCDPDRVPDIPNCDVLLARPSLSEVLRRVVDGRPDPAKVEEGNVVIGGLSESDGKCCGELSVGHETYAPSPAGGDGLAVCASGPQELTIEAANAVAALKLSKRERELGSIVMHTEVYAI